MRVGCRLESLHSQNVARSANVRGQASEKEAWKKSAQLLKTNILAHRSQGPGPPKHLCQETTLWEADLVVLVLPWHTAFGGAMGECQCAVILTYKAGRCHPVPVGGALWEAANGDVRKRVSRLCDCHRSPGIICLSVPCVASLVMEDDGGEFTEKHPRPLWRPPPWV